jgi:aminoglycoside 3-N-acetyltransferase I
MQVFADTFEDQENYQSQPPSASYIANFLANASNLIWVVEYDGKVVGGLTGYILDKFEQERRELFVYDLAIAVEHQRKGLGKELFRQLQIYAHQHKIYQLFVEADAEDEGAISFYRSLDTEELVAHHFTLKPLVR